MAVNGGGGLAGDDEIMAFGLTRDAGADRLYERPVGSRAAQRLTQIDGVLLAQTHIKRAGASDPHPIAALAEIVRKRSDKPEASSGLLDVVIARGAAGGVGRWDQGQRFREAS